MRVLLINNGYQQKGGEDAVVDNEQKLLASKNQVLTYSVNNSSINNIITKVNTALTTHYSKKQKDALSVYLLEHKPDIVQVHNFFPLLTLSIYDACVDAGIPVVQTLHNYRTVCAGALLMRNGKICEQCLHASPYQAIIHQCYRNSIAGSFFVARMVNYHRKNNTWNTKVNRFIALTEFAKNKFIEAGFPAHKIAVKPNFIEDPFNESSFSSNKEDFAIFVGRFSQEKGVSVLLNAWKAITYLLMLAGDGPIFDYCKINTQQNTVFLGNQRKQQLHELLTKAKFLIMPSIWYEGFPMVLVEAFAHGVPVICSRLGSMAEIVEDSVTGLHFEAGNADDLVAKINWLIAHPDECLQMGQNARAVYLEKYTPEQNYQQLMAIYQQVVAEGVNN
jgi:glycosyltransferase involved in cell wall biosynthesis